MATQDIASMTWGETGDLVPANATATLDRLYAVVGKFAAAKDASGNSDAFHKADAPRMNDPPAVRTDFTALMALVTSPPATLVPPFPNRVALLETDQTGNTLVFPARAPSWVNEAATIKAGVFRTREAPTRYFQLFESPSPPGGGEPDFVSELSGTGMPPVVPIRRWFRNPNWWIGLAGGFSFFLALFSILWTATSFSQAYDLLAGRQPEQLEAFGGAFPATVFEFSKEALLIVDGKALVGELRVTALRFRGAELGDKGKTCLKELEEWGKNLRVPRTKAQQIGDVICLRIMGEAVAFASSNLVVRSDDWVGWGLRKVGRFLWSWHVPGPLAPSVSLGMPILLMIVATVVVLVALGRGVTGRPLGALISPEGRYSLALAQVTFWTVLVLTSAGAMAVFNAGLVSEHLRDVTAESAAAIATFPLIPQEIWAVLGISFVSPVVATLIKGLKPDAGSASVAVQTGGPASITFLSQTSGIVRSDAHRASIADWFLGEEGANKDRIDISRVQMVMVTAGLIVTYGSEIFAFTRDVSPAAMVAAIAQPSALFATMPAVGATMAGLLLVSHATYLVAKAADKK